MEISNISPEEVSFTSEDMFKKISRLFSASGINPRWNQEVEYALPIKYLEFDTILTFKKDGGSVYIYIHPFLEDEDNPPCLEIVAGEYTKENGQTTTEAYIEHIFAGKCKIPSTGSGTWLMKLANKILCILGIQESHLLDLSTISCKNSNKYARLIFLNVYKGKYKSWYENFGYKSKEDKSNIVSVMRALRNTNAKNILAEFENVSIHPLYVGYYDLDEEKQKIKDILRLYPPSNKLLGEYMSELWDIDCESYATIDSFLLRTRGSWEDKIQFLHGIGIMDNYSVCESL